MMQKAMERQGEGNSAAAIAMYRKILDDEPLLARAHLNLAFLLDDEKHDYVGAIYHYQRYLELRPETAKKIMIQDRVRMGETSFAATIFKQAPDYAREIKHLKRKNSDLQAYINRLKRDAHEQKERARRPQAEIKQTRPADASAHRAQARPAVRHRVKPGDTLSSIAEDVYGDPGRWRTIYEANKEQLGNSHRIRIGQELIIPAE